MTASIVRAAIHPAIGIARVGSSDDWLLAPQVPEPAPRPVGSSHDAQGRLKREAVEFRVYGYDADGAVIAELTADTAEIVWSVHVANAKAAWYKFRHAMDVPTLSETVVSRRNPDVTDPAARRALVIDPGPRSISGRAQGGRSEHVFDTGTFKGSSVYLGELATTDEGRLRFLPGRGVSASPDGLPPFVGSEQDAFGNATGWHDDMADGPVDAIVRINGEPVPVTGAWVVSAPPSYAPDLKSWRTLYDVLVDLYVGNGWLPRPSQVSFARDIQPMLARLSGLQWVNAAFASVFGHGAPFDFASPALLDKLRRHDEPDVHKPLRGAVFSMFRSVRGAGTGHRLLDAEPGTWPWLYGDSFDASPKNVDPDQFLALGGERLRMMKAWVRGDFVSDLAVPEPTRIEEYPLELQPAALDRASLDFCVADAFHPGIELTWPMRHLSIYSEPFRIRRRQDPEADYGPTLDRQTALGAPGPLHGQFAGSLSRWMLVPWQIDTGGCLSGYLTDLLEDAPSFWPARVPNTVLSHANYLKAIDPGGSAAHRSEAFAERRSWFFKLGTSNWGEQLIAAFGSMGVIEAYEGLPDDCDIPPTIYAETLPLAPAGWFVPEAQVVAATDRRGIPQPGQRDAMRRMRFGR